MMVKSMRFMIALIMALALTPSALPVKADVFRLIPLQPFEAFARTHDGAALGTSSDLSIQGKNFRITRWRFSQPVGPLAAAIERNMTDLLFPNGSTGHDAVEYVDDTYAVFAALLPTSDPDPDPDADSGLFEPNFFRLVALQPLETGTELSLTERVLDSPEQVALGELASAMRWSLDGEIPQWRNTMSDADTQRQTLMFLSMANPSERFQRRKSQLSKYGFVISDLSESKNGIMIAAKSSNESIYLFSYVDIDNTYVELMNIESRRAQ